MTAVEILRGLARSIIDNHYHRLQAMSFDAHSTVPRQSAEQDVRPSWRRP